MKSLLKKRARSLKLILLLALGIYGLVMLGGCISQRDFVWPMSVEEHVDRPVPPNAEAVWVDLEDGGKVEGWFFQAEGEKTPVIMFFHGNNEVMDYCLEYPETYLKYGISVMLVEYRGYGRSDGLPSQEGVRADMIQFYDWLAANESVDPKKIVFQGRSIGGAVAADLAAYRKPAALILSATFTSMERMFWKYGVPGFIAADKYDTKAVLEQADYPVLVMHGRRDNIIPVKLGRELGELGQNTTYIEYEANHDLPVNWEEYEEDLILFLQDAWILLRLIGSF